MHSSMMCTARLLPVSPSMYCGSGSVCSWSQGVSAPGEGVSAPGPGGSVSRTGGYLSMQWGRTPPHEQNS